MAAAARDYAVESSAALLRRVPRLFKIDFLSRRSSVPQPRGSFACCFETLSIRHHEPHVLVPIGSALHSLPICRPKANGSLPVM